MQLTVWTYEGPPHVGAMRIATAMRDVHYVLHAPQGDTYADLLFTMIERLPKRPPVTYTTFQARDLGGDTAGLFQDAVRDVFERFQPKAILVGASCTAELIQDDPGGLARALNLPIPVVPLELPSYQKKENWGAAETFYQLVRALNSPHAPPRVSSARRVSWARVPAAISSGPRHWASGIVTTYARSPRYWSDSASTSTWLRRSARHPATWRGWEKRISTYCSIRRPASKRRNGSLAPLISRPLNRFRSASVQRAISSPRSRPVRVDSAAALQSAPSHSSWYSHSVDSTYLTGKRVFIFGDATHAVAAARIAADELGFTVVAIGTYSREFAREVREAAKRYGAEALITDDYLEVEAKVNELQPELVLGTQMERHIAKRLKIPCTVISAPVHVQDFPARYSPQMGFEGANVIFDTWVHPLMMGLEEHLLTMFRGDFEFNDAAPASHLDSPAPSPPTAQPVVSLDAAWAPEAEKELGKIPFFVRGKARRNTEKFAAEHAVNLITVETLYDAKAHYSR